MGNGGAGGDRRPLGYFSQYGVMVAEQNPPISQQLIGNFSLPDQSAGQLDSLAVIGQYLVEIGCPAQIGQGNSQRQTLISKLQLQPGPFLVISRGR